jgi:hypothetical protein
LVGTAPLTFLMFLDDDDKYYIYDGGVNGIHGGHRNFGVFGDGYCRKNLGIGDGKTLDNVSGHSPHVKIQCSIFLIIF